MIIKGSARGGAGELATHLLRQDTNERVTVLEMSGVASLDLRGALTELDYMGAGSRSERRLYHASVNTPSHEPLNFVEQHRARERLAAEFGLTERPYVMVEHVKHGRQHLHIVWSRVDPETGKAISDSHNYRRHEIVSHDLALEFGRTPVAGVHIRDKETEVRPARGPTWGEQLQAERSGISPAEVKKTVTAIWQATSTGHQFMSSLEAEGFTIARGDRRDFTLIDPAGEVHSLARRIGGVKAAQIRERLADLDLNQLPDVAQARTDLQRQQTLAGKASPAFTSAVERLRAEDKKRETDEYTRPKLQTFDREAADGIWQLNKTMRVQMDVTVVQRPPVSFSSVGSPHQSEKPSVAKNDSARAAEKKEEEPSKPRLQWFRPSERKGPKPGF